MTWCNDLVSVGFDTPAVSNITVARLIFGMRLPLCGSNNHWSEAIKKCIICGSGDLHHSFYITQQSDIDEYIFKFSIVFLCLCLPILWILNLLEYHSHIILFIQWFIFQSNLLHALSSIASNYLRQHVGYVFTAVGLLVRKLDCLYDSNIIYKRIDIFFFIKSAGFEGNRARNNCMNCGDCRDQHLD